MFWHHLLPAIIWALFIFLLTALPGSDMPDLSFWELLTFDKAAHAFVFCLLVIMSITGFRKQYQYRRLRYNAVKVATAVAIAYGGLIEILQGTLWAERTADLMDFIANTIGCLLGVAAFRLIYGKM